MLLAALAIPAVSLWLLQAEAAPPPDEILGHLYVNNDSAVNSVRAFEVRRSGRLASLPDSPYATLGRGGTGGFPAFPTARPTLARKGRFLYAANTQSASISGFEIRPDGSLAALGGSPFPANNPGSLNLVEGLATHPDLPFLFAGDATGLIRSMVVTATGELVPSGAASVLVGDRPEDIAVSPDGTLLAVISGVSGGRVHIFTIGPEGELTPAPGTPAELQGAEFSGGVTFDARGERLFAASEATGAGQVHVFDVAHDGTLTTAPGSAFALSPIDFPDDLVLSPDGLLLYVADPFTQAIVTLAVAADGSLSQLSTFVPDAAADEPSGLALTPDGRLLFTANFSDRSIGILEVSGTGDLTPAGFSPVLEAQDDGLISGGILFVTADPDGDGASLDDDNCPQAPNDLQQDIDADAVGDVCDNCVARFNPDQADADQDGAGDRCDQDADDDGAAGAGDNCPTAANAGQEDLDTDLRGDACDNCPGRFNPSQEDADHDEVGDACAGELEGFLYLNTNHRFNSVASFRVSRDGRLEPLPGSPFLTGGGGTLGSSVRLAFPGVVMAREGRYLYATNADTRSVSGFAVRQDGTLQVLPASPFNIDRLNPAAMAVSRQANMLYIGFAQAVFLQALRIEPDGRLTPAPGLVPIPGVALELAVSPDGRFLLVSAFRGPFYEVLVFSIDAGGGLALLPAPRFQLPVSAFPTGMTFDRTGRNVFLSDENLVHVLSMDPSGSLAPVPGSPFLSRGDGGSALALSPDGLRLFVSDGSGNRVSSLTTRLHHGQAGAWVLASSPYPNAPGGLEPAGMALSQGGKHLFVENVQADLISIFNVAPDGSLRRNRHSPAPTGVAGGQARGDMVFLGLDPDADGVESAADSCPFDADAAQLDSDADGAGDACDTCPGFANPGNADLDHDGTGDACEDDRDGDGLPDAVDICPEKFDPQQPDSDRDGRGDFCDTCPFDPGADADGDGRCTPDNCPAQPNPGQEDADLDGAGDLCDADADADQVDGLADNCPVVPNAAQQDSDRDGVGDACDVCPFQPDPAQLDADKDGAGDVCEELPAGLLYVNNNSPAGNTISGFRVTYGGALTPLAGSPFDAAAVTVPGDREAPRLAVDSRRALLFALNETSLAHVSVMKIAPDGKLTHVVGSPFRVAGCGTPIGLALSSDGTLLAVAQKNPACVTLMSVSAGGFLTTQPGATVSAPGAIAGIDISPDGRYVAASMPDTAAVFVCAAGPGLTLAPVPGSPFPVNPSRGAGVSGLRFSPAGDRLWVGGRRALPPSEVSTFEVMAGGVLVELPSSPSAGQGIGPSNVASTPDGRIVLGGNLSSNSVDVFRVTPTGQPATTFITQNIPPSSDPAGFAFNQRGDRVFAANRATNDIGVFSMRRDGRMSRLAATPVGTGDPAGRPADGIVFFEGDADGDGLGFGPDLCPAVFDPVTRDADADGVGDLCDNCPEDVNRGQLDTDHDGMGDGCDPDDDNDGFLDQEDGCDTVATAGQGDQDADGLGDVCDADRDGDGFGNADDICPGVPDPGQEDFDRDRIGDACEREPIGILYLESNAPANTVAGFLVRRKGQLEPLPGSPFPTGGAGMEEMSPGLPGLTVAGGFLLAVNGGSGDVSSMRILQDGALQNLSGSPVAAPGAEASGVAADPVHGNILVAGGPNRRIDLMTLDSQGSLKPIDSLPLDAEVSGLAFEPSRSVFAFSMAKLNRVEVFRSQSRGSAFRAPGSPFAGDPGGSTGPLLFGSGGGALYAGDALDDPAGLTLYSVSSFGALTRQPSSPSPTSLPGIAALSLSEDAARLYMASVEEGRSQMFDVSDTGQPGGPVSFTGRSTAGAPAAAVFGLNGSLLFVAHATNNLSVFGLGPGKTVQRLGPAPVSTGSDGGVPAGGLVLLTGDLDGDGLVFGEDDCPFAFNPHQQDRDGDGTGDACDVSHPPLADAGGDRVVECLTLAAGPGSSHPAGTLVMLDGRGSRDPDTGQPGAQGIVAYEWFEDFALPAERFLGEGETLDAVLDLGLHRISLRTTDADLQRSVDTVTIDVRDTQPPSLKLSPTPATLLPPDHRLVGVSIPFVVTDACRPSASVTLRSVVSNEPDDAAGGGDGRTTGDIRGAEPGTPDTFVQLRAERDATRRGRTYTLTYQAVDDAGNTAIATTVVSVPLSR